MTSILTSRPASPPFVSDAQVTERLVRHHARTFSLASRFLPAAKRRAVLALYAFCCVADDLVDAGLTPRDAAQVRQRLAEYGRQLVWAGEGGRLPDPVWRELQWAMQAYHVPLAVLAELLAGVERDLAPVRYATWGALARYCEGVASTVGEMCTWVFGVVGGAAERERALGYARTLGVAMQLTNILRDVGEDAARGRCYLPEQDLERFGLTSGEVLGARLPARDERWSRFMAFQVGRARALYAEARPGIALLHPDSQRCAIACAEGYEGILGAIEANGYDSFSVRAHLNTAQRLRVLWMAWRSAPVVPDVRAIGDGPRIPSDFGEAAGPREHATLA